MEALNRSGYRTKVDVRTYERLQTVIGAVGLNNLERFNRWAFRCHPVAYDDNLVFMWHNAHSNKVDGDPDEVLGIIFNLWRSLNEDWSSVHFGD